MPDYVYQKRKVISNEMKLYNSIPKVTWERGRERRKKKKEEMPEPK